MDTEKIVKIAALNLGIAVVNIILFSPGLLGIEIGGESIFQTAFGATVILMSGIIFLLGNYKLIVEKEKVIAVNEISTTLDFINALEQQGKKKTFSKDVVVLLEQIKSFQKKKETIGQILLQKFDRHEMSYAKFHGVISEVESLLYLNIKSILNKLSAFDEDDYNRMKKDNAQGKFSNTFIQAKMSIYNEYILFVKDSTEDNEQILLKLDKLLLEISKFNSLEDGEIENMSAMKEIDELISKTKYYK